MPHPNGKNINEGYVIVRGTIALMNPKTVTDHADFKPGTNSLPSTGIPYVIVNGTIVVKDSKVQDGVFPGQPIRNPVIR